MAQGAAAEAAPLSYLIVGLALMVGYAVCLGLLYAWRSTISYLLERLAAILDVSILGVHLPFGKPLSSLDHTMQGVLSAAAAKLQGGAGYFFHGAARIQAWITGELYALGAEIYDSYYWLRHVHLPKVTTIIRAEAMPRALIAKYVGAAVRPIEAKLEREIRAAVHTGSVVITQRVELPHLADWQWLHKHWKALTEALAGAGLGAVAGRFPWVHVFPRLGALERWEVTTKKRLRRVEALLGVSGLALAMANVLGLPNWRCLTRGNVGRMARGLCGIPAHLLTDLLGLITDFFVLTEVCEVVRLLQDAAQAIEPEVLDFVTFAASLPLCAGESTPERFAVPGFQATPVSASLAIEV